MVAGRLMRLIQRWDERNQRRADRSDAKRRENPSFRREITGRDGSRFSLVAQPHGYPDMERYTAATIWLPGLLALVLDAVFFVRHRILLHGAWRVNLNALDERGFKARNVRRIVVPSKKDALTAMNRASTAIEHDGLAGLDASMGSLG